MTRVDFYVLESAAEGIGDVQGRTSVAGDRVSREAANARPGKAGPGFERGMDSAAKKSEATRDVAVCRLTHKAFAQGHRVYLLTPDEEAARRLDALLWTFNQGSFVPHAIHPAPNDAPVSVLIGTDEPPADHNDVLIQLAVEPPASFERFQRVLEVVGPNESDKQHGRTRFRFYRERGCTPTMHTL